MESEFDKVIDRGGTSSFKYDERLKVFGRADVQPLSVADMDFAVAPAVQAALKARAAHPIYGYTIHPESLYQALAGWMAQRHGWKIEREWIMMCPGIVTSLHAAIIALSKPGDAVIVQPPVYAPLLAAPKMVGRRLTLNPLRVKSGRYEFDYDHLEQCAEAGARLLLLCSPHNPVGRVWRPEELAPVIEICRRYEISVLSDEVHADLVYPGIRHVPLAKLNEGAAKILTAVAPSKTFNIPGLGLSALIVPDRNDRSAIERVLATLHVGAANPFSVAAFEAAYRDGAQWLEELLAYLESNRQFASAYFRQNSPWISVIKPEGTYLLWLDCSAMGLSDKELETYFVHQVGVGLNPGRVFGKGGSGFMRMNIALPRSLLGKALERIARAGHP